MAPIEPANPNDFIGNSIVSETLSPIQRILIIGAGWTGRQIAGQMVAYGLDVTLVDNNSQALDVSRTWILDQRESFIEQMYWPGVSHEQLANRIHLATGIDAVVGDFDLVLESVSEQFSLKRRIIKAYSERFQTPSIIASNSRARGRST